MTATLMALVSAGAYWALSSSLEQTLLAAKADSSQAVASLFAANVSAAVDFDDAEGIQGAFKHLATNGDVTAAAIWSDPPADAGGSRGTTLKSRYVRPGHVASAQLVRAKGVHRTWGEHTLALSLPVLSEDKRLVAHAVVEFSLRSERAKIATTKRKVLVTSVAVAAALVVLLLVASRRAVLLPLRRLEESARRIERGEDGAFGRYADDEVGALASALKQMAGAVQERESEIKERNRDMRLVLDNVGQGFLRLSPAGVVSGEYSRVVEEWFGKPAPDATLSAYLSDLDPAFANGFALAFEQLVDGALPLVVALAQAPTRISARGRVWTVDYRLVAAEEEEVLKGVIVVITDVTELLAKERSERAQREVIAASTRIAHDAQGFSEFLTEAGALVKAACASSDDGMGSDGAVVARALHTLKGICGTMEAWSVAATCHELEEQLVELGGRLNEPQKQQLSTAWTDYTTRIGPLMRMLDDNAVVIERARFQAFVAAVEAARPHAELLREARSWGLEDAQKPLERLAQSAQELAQRLGKGELCIDVQSSHVRLPRGACPRLWASLVHLVRNAVDHGLERPEERKNLGKPAAGRLSISGAEQGDAFLISVRDDGRGIDWSVVRERARVLGLPHATPEELKRALLSPGLTTREHATQTSGRGIGTAAVAEVVASLGGRIDIDSVRGQGTTFRVEIPRDRLMLAS